MKGRGLGCGCPRGRTGGGALDDSPQERQARAAELASGRSEAAAEPGASLQRMLSLAAAATVPSVPSAGGGDARAPAPPGELV